MNSSLVNYTKLFPNYNAKDGIGLDDRAGLYIEKIAFGRVQIGKTISTATIEVANDDISD